MQQFFELVKRNVRLYLRDRGAVFFSLLSMLIVIGLMLFFLGDMNIEAITDILGKFPGRDAAADEENAKLLVLMWTSAGIVSINAVTVSFASLSAMIKDRTTGKINSIYSAPVSRFTISAAYICSAWVSSVIMCTAALVISELYCVSQGAEAFSVTAHLQLLGMIAVNSFAYSSLMYFASFLAKTEGAWSGFGTVAGTLVGFLGGIYLPIGALAESIGNGLKCTPIIYGASMFRQIMTEDMLSRTFDGISADIIGEYSEAMGITLTVFDNNVSCAADIVILLVFGGLFLVFGALVTEHSRKTDR